MEDGRHEVSLHFGFDVEDAIQRARRLEDTLRSLDSAISGSGASGGMPTGLPTGSGSGYPGAPTHSARTNPDMPLTMPEGGSPQQVTSTLLNPQQSAPQQSGYNNVVPHNAPPVVPQARLSNVGEGYYPLLNQLEESHLRVQQLQRQGRYDLARPEYLGQRSTIEQLMELSERRREEALGNAQTPYERERVQYAFDHQRRGYQSQLEGVDRSANAQNYVQAANMVARSGLPGSSTVASILGGMGEGAGIAAAASTVALAGVVALAGKFIINAIDVGVQRATIVSGGTFVPESQQRILSAQQAYGWIPFVGPRMMQINSAGLKFEGELSSIGQINEAMGGIGGGVQSNGAGRIPTYNGISSLFYKTSSGDNGIMDAPGTAPIKGASTIAGAYLEMLKMMPEMGRSMGSSRRFVGWGSGIVDRFSEGAAPEYMQKALGLYSQMSYLQMADSADAAKGRFDFGASMGTTARRFVYEGDIASAGSAIAAANMPDDERLRLLRLARNQMGHRLNVGYYSNKQMRNIAMAQAAQVSGIEFMSQTDGSFAAASLDGIGTEETEQYLDRYMDAIYLNRTGTQRSGGTGGIPYTHGSRPTTSDYLQDAQEQALRAYRNAENYAANIIPNMGVADRDIRQLLDAAQKSMAEAWSQYASLGKQRGMGMLDYYTETKQIEASSLSAMGFNPTKFITAQADAYGMFLGNQEFYMGDGVKLNSLESAQMRLKKKQMELGAIEATASYHGGIASAQMQQFGAYGGAYSTMYGSAASTPYSLAVASAAGTAVGVYQQRLASLAAFGAGPGLLEPARAQVAQAYGQQVSTWMGATQFQASPQVSEALAQSQFNLQALTTAFGTRGSVRGEYRQVQGALGQQLEELQRQRQNVMANAPAEMRPRLEFEFNQQQRAIQYQLLSTQQTLQEGWLERVMGGVWNAPRNMDMVLNEFNYAGAVKRGVRARHLGATSADVAMYQSQAFLGGGGGVAFQGAYGIPEDFTAAGFMGIGGLPSRRASGAATPPGGPGAQQTVVIDLRVNGRSVGSGSGQGVYDTDYGASIMWNTGQGGNFQ